MPTPPDVPKPSTTFLEEKRCYDTRNAAHSKSAKTRRFRHKSYLIVHQMVRCGLLQKLPRLLVRRAILARNLS